MAHFKLTGDCLLVLTLNFLNTKIYLLMVIYKDLFELIHVDLLELIHGGLFPKIYRTYLGLLRENGTKKDVILSEDGGRLLPVCLAGKHQTCASYKINLAFYGQIEISIVWNISASETNTCVPGLSAVRCHSLLPTGNVQTGTGVTAV
jgi:hypothetical protein